MSRPLPQTLDAHRALPATEVLIGRIAWLIRLRWVGVGGTIAFTEFAHWTLPIQLQTGRIRLLVLALAAYNLIAWLALGRHDHADAKEPAISATSVPDHPGALARWLLPRTAIGTLPYDRQAGRSAIFAFVQITTDLLLLALLLHFSGGVENPAWVFFTFHIIFASVLLSRRATYALATFASLLLIAVVLGELSGFLPHYSLGTHWGLESYLQPGLIGAYLFLQTLTLFATAYLASSVTGRLRRREVDVLVLTRELTEKAERLEAAYQELSIAERSKSQYMRKVAHELRQPLGTIKTALAVALQNAADSLEPQTRTIIERAERRAGALAEMTQELLSLSRARGGRAAVEMEPVEIAVVAARVLDELHSRALEYGIALSVDLQAGLPPLIGDAEGLTDMIGNLIGNAIRYTPAGGRVWFRTSRDHDRLVVEVEDTGIGIPAADRHRIFEDFYRSPAAREHAPQGSGLGLAIVRAVVEQHQGSITVEEREGGGTRFRVELPHAEPAGLALDLAQPLLQARNVSFHAEPAPSNAPSAPTRSGFNLPPKP